MRDFNTVKGDLLKTMNIGVIGKGKTNKEQKMKLSQMLHVFSEANHCLICYLWDKEHGGCFLVKDGNNEECILSQAERIIKEEENFELT